MVSTLKFDLPAPDISAWRAGNTGTEGVWHFDSGKPGRNVLISALIHGNELCGAWALKGLLEAGVKPEQGTLTLAFCNINAFDKFDPNNHDASRFVDQDMNRQWSDERIDAGDTAERRRAAALRAAEDARGVIQPEAVDEIVVVGGLAVEIDAAEQEVEHPVERAVDMRFGRILADIDTRAVEIEAGRGADRRPRAPRWSSWPCAG